MALAPLEIQLQENLQGSSAFNKLTETKQSIATKTQLLCSIKCLLFMTLFV